MQAKARTKPSMPHKKRQVGIVCTAVQISRIDSFYRILLYTAPFSKRKHRGDATNQQQVQPHTRFAAVMLLASRFSCSTQAVAEPGSRVAWCAASSAPCRQAAYCHKEV